MGLKRAALLSGSATVALALAVLPAAAAPRTHATAAASVHSIRVAASTHTRRHRHYVRRARTRITVHKRSFLDPGTEESPGESKQLDYAIPPFYEPMQVVSGPDAPSGWQNPFEPLPGHFFPWPP